MFASRFGEELLELKRLVLFDSKNDLADMVDLYLCSEAGLELPEFYNRPGIEDLLALIHQKCVEAEVSDVVGFLRMTAPIFVRDDWLLRKSFRGMSANQVSDFVRAINTVSKAESYQIAKEAKATQRIDDEATAYQMILRPPI